MTGTCTDANKHIKLVQRFLDAAGLLIIHGIITDRERANAQKRIEHWASRHGLMIKKMVSK